MKISILSTKKDLSTTEIIEWLRHYNCKVKRIHLRDQNISISLKLTDKSIQYVTDDKDLEESQVVWYRRGFLTDNNCYRFSFDLDEKILDKIVKHLKSEYSNVLDEYYSCHSNQTVIGNPLHIDVNKLSVLRMAKLLGLNVPNTLITNRKQKLLETLDIENGIISKPTTDLLNLRIKNHPRSHLINLISKEEVNKLPNSFGTSFFQEFIPKKFEIRSFIFLNKVFSIANFTSLNKLSYVDGRHILNEDNCVNRIVPFVLPESIKVKAKELINELKLDTGSIDFIYSTTGQFYFLEVNPVGQFGYVSQLGGFNISKFISEKLISNGKEIIA